MHGSVADSDQYIMDLTGQDNLNPEPDCIPTMQRCCESGSDSTDPDPSMIKQK
jgi:hypothetical protein